MVTSYSNWSPWFYSQHENTHMVALYRAWYPSDSYEFTLYNYPYFDWC
jgi:hypothetical protein